MKLVNRTIFLLSVISLVISMVLFYNLAIYCDEYNASPEMIYGGNWRLLLEWGNLIILFFICLLAGFRLFRK